MPSCVVGPVDFRAFAKFAASREGLGAKVAMIFAPLYVWRGCVRVSGWSAAGSDCTVALGIVGFSRGPAEVADNNVKKKLWTL